MKPTDLALLRLKSQQISESSFSSAKELVSWMGAMQAQDHYMVKWALGTRIAGTREQQMEEAINSGDIIRTHALRPTWHLVPAADVYWMLELSYPQIITAAKTWYRKLELTPAVLNQTNTLLEKWLGGGKHLTREDIVAGLQREGINTDNNRTALIMIQAELDGIVGSGSLSGKKQTYALLAERCPVKTTLTREEALNKLALRYFTSHGPATLQDFTWWSGLPVRDARNALEMVKSQLVYGSSGTETYWYDPRFSSEEKAELGAYFLPAFDEFLISYKDRSACLPAAHHQKAVSVNGIFHPVMLIQGKIEGLWKRTLKKNKVIIETHFFTPPGQKIKNIAEEAASRFGLFLEKEPEIIHR